jgi:signal transduction histidine kinase
MKRIEQEHGYQGGFLIGFIIITAVVLRTIIHFQGKPAVTFVIALLALYTILYSLEPWLSVRFGWQKYLYFPVQTVIVIVLTNLHPFTDISCLLYVPLSIQILRRFPPRAASAWLIIYLALLALTLMRGLGGLAGLALVLSYLAVYTFLASYDFLFLRTQADQAESQHLLADLLVAHRKLQEYASQAQELAAARERNRLARELHDSVSQAIFSITLTSQAARLLLDREPARVSEQIDRLQIMTEAALNQLRSLIAQLRPPQNS